MYIIVVGAGSIGRPLIEIATGDRNEVVVIEQHHEKAERAAKAFDCLVIEADATAVETLEDAGVGRADAVISTTDQDATNIMVSLLAAEHDVPQIVSVVHNPEHMGIFERIGVTTMENPQRLISEYLYRAVSRPSIKDYMRVGETAEVFEITVDDDAPVAGLTLQEANEAGELDEDVLVVAIEREGADGPITPRGNTTLEAGDLVTVYSATGATPDVTDVFGHYEDRES
jgi:trk system potassium uptake protein TrkA